MNTGLEQNFTFIKSKHDMQNLYNKGDQIIFEDHTLEILMS